MSKFKKSLLQESGAASVTAELAGHGEMEFDLVERSVEGQTTLRKAMVKKISGHAQGGVMSNEDADSAYMACGVMVLQNCLVEKMDEMEAFAVVGMSGGYRGELVRKIGALFGVGDLFPAEVAREAQDELPTS